MDYVPFATTGIVNPLLGDVSLNGRVLAFDASLVLQHLVSAVVLNPLQLLVADVSGTAGVSALDASLILQYAAGIIPSFPANTNKSGQAPDPAVAQALARADGDFELTLGEWRRAGGHWELPVRVEGGAAVYGLELTLDGVTAALEGAAVPEGAMHAVHAERDAVHLALASAEGLATGEVAVIRVGAGTEAPARPRLAFARVNERTVREASPVAAPRTTAFARPFPNPANGPVRLALAIASTEEGEAADVQVLDVSGRTVRQLAKSALAVGEHAWVWDQRGDDGRRVPPGIYLVRARTRTLDATHRLIVIR